jgi:hypothetical protein
MVEWYWQRKTAALGEKFIPDLFEVDLNLEFVPRSKHTPSHL